MDSRCPRPTVAGPRLARSSSRLARRSSSPPARAAAATPRRSPPDATARRPGRDRPPTADRRSPTAAAHVPGHPHRRRGHAVTIAGRAAEDRLADARRDRDPVRARRRRPGRRARARTSAIYPPEAARDPRRRRLRRASTSRRSWRSSPTSCSPAATSSPRPTPSSGCATSACRSSSSTPRRSTTVLDDIALLGPAIGERPPRRRRSSIDMRPRSSVSGRASTACPQPRVFYELDATGAIYGPADDSFLAEMIGLAGGDPITTGLAGQVRHLARAADRRRTPRSSCSADAPFGVTEDQVATSGPAGTS